MPPVRRALGLLAMLAWAAAPVFAQTPPPTPPPSDPRPVYDVNVDVVPTRTEVAEQQLKEQEQQRVLAVFPNFFVTYRADAVPLNARQKFRLAFKSVTDPTRFATAGVTAGIQHARDDFPTFGRGWGGYGRRYAAAYATLLTSTMVSRAALPALFRQDPRYFYKGTGSAGSRFGYALSRAVVRKGDSGRLQPDYSLILGSIASGLISNVYYPDENRGLMRLTALNAAVSLAAAAGINVMQEFVFSRMTTRGTTK